MRIFSFTTLYPNAAQPGHGLFVETRLRHLVASGAVSLRVMAPVPWFPFRARVFGRYGVFARVPAAEERHGIAISHPRYALLPKVGMSTAPRFMYAAAKRALARSRAADGDFDLIDAHYFYPDGVAAAMLGAHFGKPVVITARGSDLNLIAQHAAPRRMIQRAAAAAAGLITVSDALKDRLVALGVPPERVRVLRNGVDLARFSPADRDAARAALGLDGPVLLAVGNVIPLKGHDLIIDALPRLPAATFLLIGDGAEQDALVAQAKRLGVAARVRFLGRVPQEDLPRYYNAADLLIHPSSCEGWPNVLLEAMACGTPVLATKVGGIPEVVAAPEAGRLLTARNAPAIVTAVEEMLAAPLSRDATRAYAERFSWQAPTEGQLALFREILGRADGEPA